MEKSTRAGATQTPNEIRNFSETLIKKRFENKTVIVTGGSKGIGRATAFRFAYEGADIIITESRDKAETQYVIDTIQSMGRNCIALPCDVGDEVSVQAFFDQVMLHCGCIDVLAHCAGISPNTPLDDQSISEWRKVLNINLIGTFLVTRYAGLIMRKNNTPGSMVLVSSSNAINSFAPISAHYDSSKAGVVILTRDLAKDLAQYNIRVNSVAPGWIDTSLNDSLPSDMRKEETEKIYLGRWGRPEEVASAIGFLASEDASFITGTTLLIDGGYG